MLATEADVVRTLATGTMSLAEFTDHAKIKIGLELEFYDVNMCGTCGFVDVLVRLRTSVRAEAASALGACSGRPA